MKFGIFLLSILLPCTIHAIEGTYILSGWDPYENSMYIGNAVIKSDGDNVYSAEWNFNDGERYTGTGLRNNGCVSFVFASTNVTKPVTGLQVYKIEGHTLTGTWVLINQNKLGSETMQMK